MLSNLIGQKVTCSYRTITQPPHMVHTWVGVILEPLPAEKQYCETCGHTPVQYPFGKMLDSDDSLNALSLVEYNGSTLHAFKDAPGWYVYAYSLLSQAGGTLDGKEITSYAHGYKIIAGPFDTEAQAQQVAKETN